MRDRGACILAVLLLCSAVGRAQLPEERKTFPTGVILIGAQSRSDPQPCEVRVISPAGDAICTMFRRETGSIFPGGRLSRQGDRLAICYESSRGKGEFLIIESTADVTKVMDGVGTITAWSPDGQQLAFYQSAPRSGSFASFVIDLNSGERTRLELPADYVAEDWRPRENTRTAIYMNPRNLLYRQKGDHYPTRQLDLLTSDGKRTPITKNPSSDNLWARFSPDGDRLAYYGRRLVGETPLEYAVVCSADGHDSKEIFHFTEFGGRVGLPWFRPNGPPAWSPDGSTLAWLVSTNTEPKADGEQLELVFVSTKGGAPRRLSLTDLGFQRVASIEWR